MEIEDLIDHVAMKNIDNILKNYTPIPDFSKIFYIHLNIPELFVYSASIGYMFITNLPMYNKNKIKKPYYVKFGYGEGSMTMSCALPDKCHPDIVSEVYPNGIKYNTIWNIIRETLSKVSNNGVAGIIVEYMLPKMNI